MSTATTAPVNLDSLETAPKRASRNDDRCDSCSARAYWEVSMESGNLVFCNHHYNRFSAKFADRPVTQIDWQDGFLAVNYNRKADSAFS